MKEGRRGEERGGEGRRGGSRIFLSPLPPFPPPSLPHPVRRTGNTASIQYLRRNLTFGILTDQHFIVQLHENYKRSPFHLLGYKFYQTL